MTSTIGADNEGIAGLTIVGPSASMASTSIAGGSHTTDLPEGGLDGLTATQHQGGTSQSQAMGEKPDKKIKKKKRKKNQLYGVGELMELALKGIPDNNAHINGTEMSGCDSEPSQENP